MRKLNFDNSIFVIDGSSFLYRAYYSIYSLTTKDGIAVNAVYGFCRMIKKLIDAYEPRYMALVWDSPGKTVRHQIYENYKAGRQAAPSDLFSQKELIKEFADMIGLKQVQMESIEADDLMYSIAKKFSSHMDVILVTSDKDLRQALSENVFILDPFKDQIMDQKVIEEKNGFPLDRLIFYYSLIGDSSDNIPGVKGVGAKTAQELAQKFKSLEDLYENLNNVSSERMRRLLIEGKDDAFLSRELFQLKVYEIDIDKDLYSFSKTNLNNAYSFFERLDFKSFLKKLETKKQVETVNLHNKYNFRTVTNHDELKQICDEIKKHKRFAIDTETTNEGALLGKMVGFSLCYVEGTSYYIPFEHQTGEDQLTKEQILPLLKEILEDESIEKCLHNAKFDILVFETFGINPKGPFFDTIIAASLLFPEGQKLGLKSLSANLLNDPMFHFKDLVGKDTYRDFSLVPIERATEYAAADAHQTFLLWKLFEKGLEEKDLRSLFDNLEIPLVGVLSKMEKEGIYIDVDLLQEINTKVTTELTEIHKQILDLVGIQFEELNLNSPKQLSQLLFDHLKLVPLKKTAGKTIRSTDNEVLKYLAKSHPVPELIMRYRELFKLKSTYLEALQLYVNPNTKRIHTSFNQIAVATGRLSSSDPNLQNIPVYKFNVRSAFKAQEGYCFISADYSQIELRVLAHFSKDPALVEAFLHNKDIHAITASKLFGVPVEEVISDQRQLGKKINFSILYGLTAHGLASDLGISHSLAKEYIDKFMAQYPQISTWMKKVIEFTKEKGYVETYLGRRRYLPGIQEKNKTLFDLARRAAINTVAQGTAAEIVKLGMIKLDKALKEQNLNAKILLQIHDELLIECPIEQLETTVNVVKNVLENVLEWEIPLLISTRVGSNWQEVTK